MNLAFLAAPLLVFAYGVIRILDGLDGARGPGLAWTTGHLAFLGALAAFLVVFVHLRRLAGRDGFSTVSVAVASAGALTLFAQFVVDIVVGFVAEDHAAMRVIASDVSDNQVVSLVLYEVGPYLFYVGLLALVIQLAIARRVVWWASALVVVSQVLPVFDKDLIPVGALVLLAPFVVIGRQVATPRRVSASV
ncbi:hypothetical protein [Actinophytocola xanthii]|uniref:DUF4386 domain-containing protein n=1 Tax=Actinophytocola xanthii TaxID=1912961 RepID=A0A1Q8CGF6_9PSEU|nr:hypothetical protein [Actinophytocola xanthii]OLF13413.1 hypothetical protein BU204_27480 [Actinophytocola xanthii]